MSAFLIQVLFRRFLNMFAFQSGWFLKFLLLLLMGIFTAVRPKNVAFIISVCSFRSFFSPQSSKSHIGIRFYIILSAFSLYITKHYCASSDDILKCGTEGECVRISMRKRKVCHGDITDSRAPMVKQYLLRHRVGQRSQEHGS